MPWCFSRAVAQDLRSRNSLTVSRKRLLIIYMDFWLAIERNKELNISLCANRRRGSTKQGRSRFKTYIIMEVLLNLLVVSPCIRAKGVKHAKICHILKQHIVSSK